jgi:hypothetical protein
MPVIRKARTDRVLANIDVSADVICDGVCDAMTGSPQSLGPSAEFDAAWPLSISCTIR